MAAQASSARRSDYTLRAVAVVVGAAAVHLVLSGILLALMVGSAGVPGQRAALGLTVVLTGLAALAVLYVRTQYSSPDHVARSVPLVLWLLPPVAGSLFLAATLPPSTTEGGVGAIIHSCAPVLCSGWGIALVLGTLVERMLRALAVRFPPATEVGVLRTIEPPTLALGHARIQVGAALSACIIALGTVATHPAFAHSVALSQPRTLVWIVVGLAALIGLAAAAALTLGQTPGRDIVSIARRLDAQGHGAQETLAAPVVPVSGDEVGQLLSHLEEVRIHLCDELRLYQQALDKTNVADVRKSEFLSAVSHELRTPLNVVGGFAQLLLEGVPEPLTEAQAEDVELIRAGGAQLLELINDILDMSMIESGELRLAFLSADIGELIRTLVKTHQPLVHDSPVVLHAEIGPNLPAVVCDAKRLRQILTNLVSNAIKFTERGTITLRAAFDPRSQGVVIRCIDTGLGIAPEDLDTIFEEYRQVGAVKRRTKGTGLGLSIARRIAGHHGGTLTVESSVSEGSTFTLRLPVDPPMRPTTIDMTEEAARTLVAASVLPMAESSDTMVELLS